ncbi:uncharacterized protein LOC135464027 isoform X2 [Liolophura sinensis]|uniref:uncharacterized protein LOC135464027 isoform X2 n=1 Tax=Liolophura sinensis TaxID=3198878 RepID=UPI003158F049
MEGFEETVYQVTDVITGREIHIVDDSGTHISIPDVIDAGDVLVADGVAAETVVTTTDVCSGLLSKDDSADSGCGMEELEEGARFADHDSSVSSLGGLGSEDIGMDSLHSTSYGTTVWPSLDIIKLKPDMGDDLGSGESLVALISDPVLEDTEVKVKKPREAQIREKEKREQDRLKKKLLRSNPDYRQKEKGGEPEQE